MSIPNFKTTVPDNLGSIKRRVALYFRGLSGEMPDRLLEERILHYCQEMIHGRFKEAETEIRTDKAFSPEQRAELKEAISEFFLSKNELEWGNHGVHKSFRFWKEDAKSAYLQQAINLSKDLIEFTPNVCFGFGAVLGLVREGGFIAHDDDLDLVIGLPSGDTFPTAKAKLKAFLESKGYVCHGDNHTHFGVNFAGRGKAVDVFIGFIEDQRISWFPSSRSGMRVEDVFPPTYANCMGLSLPVPRDAVRYVEITYGADWRTPIANWSHPWNLKEYADLF